jgi:hypothetical protein
MAADGTSELEIIISAVDEASAAFEEINESLGGVSDAAATMVDSTTASFNEFMASVAAAAAATGTSEDDIMVKMAETGQTAQDVADEIIAANAEIDASNDALSKGSFMSIGIAAGIAFAAVSSAVGDAVSSAEAWDLESATIQGELSKIASSIPLSEVQAYAQQIQATTLLTQQQALQSEGVVLGYKNLAPMYQQLTSLGADLATRMSQTSGTLSDNMPNAMQLIATAMEDPVAGMAKLVRAGVALSAQQVEQITNMAKVGNTAGAQAELLNILKGSVGGLAEAAAKAQGGPMIQLSNQLTALGTTIANSGLLTDLDSLAQAMIPIIQAVGQWVTEHPKLTEAIVIGTVAFTAFLAVAAVIGIIIAAVGSSVALAMVAISAAVAGLIAFIVPNWKTFWNGFQDVVNVTSQAIADVIEFALNLILAAVYIFQNLMTGTFNVMWDAIKLVVNLAMTVIDGVIMNQIKAIQETWQVGWNVISTIVTDVWAVIQNTVKTGVNDVISAINAFINALDAIHITLPSISIPGTKITTPAINLGFNIPDIPMLAAGGIVNSATLALIGESGPEAVIPLSSGGGYGGQQQQIVIQIQGGIFPADGSTMKQIGDLLAKSILRGMKVTGYAP